MEIHSAHGYLLNQFYSPLANHRSDDYGPQSVENRTRFHREVLQAVRRAAGEDFPVAVRLGGCDYQEGGSTLEDSTAACRILAESGTDLLHLTGGMNGFVRPGHQEPGYFQKMSRAARQAVADPGSSDRWGHHPGPGPGTFGAGRCRPDRGGPGHLPGFPLG